MNYLGIDVSKSFHRCCILDSNGETLTKNFSIESTPSGLGSLLNKFKELTLKTNNLLIGLEATGNFWENLYSFLENKGFKIILLNPYQTNKYRELLAKKAKTDNIDALVIAGLLRSGEYLKSYVPDDSVQSLRDLVRLRFNLVKDLKDYKRQVSSLLHVVFPEYTTLVPNPFGVVSCAMLKNYPTAKHFAKAHPKDLINIARSIQGNNFNHETARKLISTAKISIYSGKAQNARGLNIFILISQIQQIQDSIAKLEKSIEDILKPKDLSTPPGFNLNSIPGVGPKTLATFLAEAGDIKRFSSAKQFIGYIGLYPKIKESGTSKNSSPHLAKRGSPLLRHALYMAATASLIHNPYLKHIYEKKISQGKPAKQAIIVVARKLATMMYSMLKHNTSFNSDRIFVHA